MNNYYENLQFTPEQAELFPKLVSADNHWFLFVGLSVMNTLYSHGEEAPILTTDQIMEHLHIKPEEEELEEFLRNLIAMELITRVDDAYQVQNIERWSNFGNAIIAVFRQTMAS